MRTFNLIDTHLAIILPSLISAFGVFLMRQFFKTLPQELFDAAVMDGAGHARSFFQIALPLARAPLATLAILTFNATWNSFFLPMIFLSSWDKMTLSQGSLEVDNGAPDVFVWPPSGFGSTLSIARWISKF